MRTLLGVALLACSSCTFSKWVRQGSTRQEFVTDKYECRRENAVTTVNRRGRMARSSVDDEMFEECMLSRGWSKREYSRITGQPVDD